MDPQFEPYLRQGFKYFNRFMVGMWRLGFGPWLNLWPKGFGQYLVLTHRGRKTGLLRRTPVNFARVKGEIYITAGFGKISDWYRNIQANPHIEVWLPDGWWDATVDDVSEAEQRLPLLREVLIGSGFAAQAAGVNPYQISDEKMDALTRPYRLLHIRLTQPRTGPGGPGDLAWIWPLTVMLMLPMVLRRRKK